MCRAGGCHCPVDLGGHNERRRRNRALRDAITAWARVADPELETTAWMRQPSLAKQWAAARGVDAPVLDAWHEQEPGGDALLVRRLAAAQSAAGHRGADVDAVVLGASHAPEPAPPFAVIPGEPALGFYALTRAGSGTFELGAPLNHLMAAVLARIMGGLYAALVPDVALSSAGGRLGVLSVLGHPADLEQWSPAQVEAAAFFDVVAGQCDRNRFTFGLADGAAALFDNTAAFDVSSTPAVRSVLLDRRCVDRGLDLSVEECEVVQRLQQDSTISLVRDVVGPAAARAFAARLEAMRATGVIACS